MMDEGNGPVNLPQVVQHMRQGRTILGSQVKPYPWLDLTMKQKTETEVNIERFMTSCAFKTTTACVIGTLEATYSNYEEKCFLVFFLKVTC